ncbi:MAG: phosphate signaling complex protein PhoU [Opitutaceae bacterium]|nr:phosphate signaling complex protein PhoU [Opitutaceae bacterium]
MKRFFDSELDALRSHLVQMGEKSIEQVRLAVRAVVEGDPELARQVRAGDDVLDRLEVLIDEEGVRYMSLRNPVATDLRLVVVGMKAGHDLERVGDEANNIAKRALRLAGEAPLKPFVILPRMAAIAQEMLRDALDCFLQHDNDKALAVIRRDQEVDDLHRELYRELSIFMAEKPDTISRALELMFISKSIERIADHATNIAEEMVYLAKGEDIRHVDELKKGPRPAQE